MSRWERRSDEDKRRIASQQDIQARPKKPAKVGWLIRGDGLLEVYKAQELPMPCHRCQEWVGCDQYVVTSRDHPGTGKPWGFVSSTCRECKRPVDRYCPLPLQDEAMFFGMVMLHLKGELRLDDRRRD